VNERSLAGSSDNYEADAIATTWSGPRRVVIANVDGDGGDGQCAAEGMEAVRRRQ